MKLVSGAGSPETGACWMSAIHWYTRNGATWTDQPKCVSPIVRDLCIALNDALPTDKERERIIGPHLFTPVGTYTGEANEKKRVTMVADRAIHVFAPFWLRKTGNRRLMRHAERLERIRPILTQQNAKEVVEELDRVHKDASAYAYAYASAYAYAYASAYASLPQNEQYWLHGEVLRLILDLCEVGRVEVKTSKTKEETVEYLCSLERS